MVDDHFLTIKNPSEGIYKEKGSKFLSFAFPVNNEETVKEIFETITTKHHNARHHCFAYVIGANKENVRANDAGEPANSAGKPILNQINKNNLTNILVIVVRYFGGKLLGMGGLVNAYRTAAADAIKNAAIIKKFITNQFIIHFNYDKMDQVMKILDKPEVNQTNQQFDKDCTISVNIKKKY